jgi:hypothetical protein
MGIWLKRTLAGFSAFVLAWQIGLPQGLLKTVAWGWMIISYSQEDGLKEGLRKTFDGHHPCGLCERIAQARPDTAPATLAPVPTTSMDPFWIFQAVVEPASLTQPNILTSRLAAFANSDRASPLLPPPRA